MLDVADHWNDVVGLFVGVERRARVQAGPAVAPLHDRAVEARQQMGRLVAGIQHIERSAPRPPGERRRPQLRNAKLAVAGASDCKSPATSWPAWNASVEAGDAGEQEYAMRRLRLLAQRAHDLTRAAQVCATDEVSSIDVTSEVNESIIKETDPRNRRE